MTEFALRCKYKLKLFDVISFKGCQPFHSFFFSQTESRGGVIDVTFPRTVKIDCAYINDSRAVGYKH